MSSHILTDAEFKALKYGLKHNIATFPKQSDVMAYTEDVWEQLLKSKVIRDNPFAKLKIKNSLRAFTFNLLEIDDKRIFSDNTNLRLIKNLRKDLVILKPDKGNGIVLLNKTDYHKAIDDMFSDTSKFTKVNADPSVTRMESLQSYLRKLLKREEISQEEYDMMRPQNAKPARAHLLPKIHKSFQTLPKFRPIIDTTGTSHYRVGKYLSALLNPLTSNEFTFKDSFDAAEKIRNIPKNLFNEGYVYVSFDVESLFTNVPLNRTIKIILKRIYNE